MSRKAPGFRSCAMMALVGAALTGCGGGSGEDPRPGPNEGGGVTVADLTPAFEAMRARVNDPALFNTAFTPPNNAIPATGTARFTGFANVSLSQAGAPLVLTGPATLSIDFGTRDLTGSATGFAGVEGTAIAAYAGTVDFRNGRIGRDGPGQQPNDVRFDYEGVLVGDGNTVALDGSAAGKLRASPIRGLNAVSGPGGTATLNGTATPAPFTLVAEIE